MFRNSFPCRMTPSAWLERISSVEPPERIPLFLSREWEARYPTRYNPGLNVRVPYYLEDLEDEQNSFYDSDGYETTESDPENI